ncbi:MAG: Uma2 family endonuclease [Blastocatellia bacterium]|nr:Uma2 family endonuclease [Blastocatellia bacterium]
MTTEIANYYDIVTRLPADTVVTFHGVSWQDYEDLLEQVGEAGGLRISFDSGTLTIMTLSTEHENYAWFIGRLVSAISLRLRINIRFFGSATMKKRKEGKGNEPDACFYVQTADALGNRIQLDFEEDPPPDIVVEVDVHHDSLSIRPIYVALGVPEIWRYDGQELTIHLLEEGDYVSAPESLALPFLTGQILTEFLTRLRDEGGFNRFWPSMNGCNLAPDNPHFRVIDFSVPL